MPPAVSAPKVTSAGKLLTLGANRTGLRIVHSDLDRSLPTLLFVNAVGMEAVLLADMAGTLISSGYNFVTWDLRGSPGPSQRPEDHQLETHVADAVAVLEELEIHRPALAGWCTGASVALAVAELIGKRVSSLLLVDGAYLFEGTPGGRLGDAMYAMCQAIVADPSMIDVYHELVVPRGNEAAVLGLEGRPELLPHLLLPYNQGAGALLRYARAIKGACDYDPAPMLRALRCPTMLIASVDDRMVSWRNSEAAAQLVVDSLLLLLARGGHYNVLTNPILWRQMVAFLDVSLEHRGRA